MALVDLVNWRVIGILEDKNDDCWIIPDGAPIRKAPQGFDILAFFNRGGDTVWMALWCAVRFEGNKIKASYLQDWSPFNPILHNAYSITNNIQSNNEIVHLADKLSASRPPPAAGRNRKAARVANDKGLAALQENNFATATSYFEEGVRADKDDVELLNNLGYAYLLQGKLEEATGVLREALLREPKRVNAWVNLGQVFAAQSAQFEKLQQLQPLMKVMSSDSELASSCFAIALHLSAKPDKTLAFLRGLTDKDSSPALHTAVERVLAQDWIETLQSTGFIHGQVFRDCTDCPEMVCLEGGTFQMGTKDHDILGDTRHQVTVSPFAIGKYEVTRGQLAAFANATGYKTEAQRNGSCRDMTDSASVGQTKVNWKTPGFPQDDTHPAVCVSWDDAVAYTQWLSQKTGQKYRLPSEAEWEYAARTGTTTCYFFGDDAIQLDEYAWYNKNSDGKIHSVGQKKPNAWGLYDIYGNVWEWGGDWYDQFLDQAPSNLATPRADSVRLALGGGWKHPAESCFSVARNWGRPIYCGNDQGFRLARNVCSAR